MEQIPSKVAFETKYGDDSGVECAVRYDAFSEGSEIEIESIDSVTFPANKIDWLIGCLREVKDIIDDNNPE